MWRRNKFLWGTLVKAIMGRTDMFFLHHFTELLRVIFNVVKKVTEFISELTKLGLQIGSSGSNMLRFVAVADGEVTLLKYGCA